MINTIAMIIPPPPNAFATIDDSDLIPEDKV
jgi:hypothetical protein